MSASPFLDLTVVAALLEDLAPATVRSIEELAEIGRGQATVRANVLPALALVPEATSVAGPGGQGNDRIITDGVVVVSAVRALAREDSAALDALRAIRTAVWSALEGVSPGARWSVLRLQGGALLSLGNGMLAWADRYSAQRGAPAV